MTDFKELNLSTKILTTLEKQNYTKATPIQAQAIPHLLAGKDLLGIAQTGTGKTAAFAIPILENLGKSNNSVRANNVRALILTPTRELAAQIHDKIQCYGESFKLRSDVIFGGVNIKPQIAALSRGSDIVIATPGRLLDLLNQGYVHLMRVEIFVLDEADRMLDMGFIRDINKIVAKLPKNRQNLLFSATMPKDISSLANSLLNDPVKIEVTPESTTVDKIDQKVHLVAKEDKPALLKAIINQKTTESVLVFTKTKYGANRVERYLNKVHITAEAIHGDKVQSAREKALDSFRSGKTKVLIATDIVARGIDIPHITHVINFDLPHDPESYVHRIGRTARAGRSGIAITFCDPSEHKMLKAVEQAINYHIPRDHSHPFSDVKDKHNQGSKPNQAQAIKQTPSKSNKTSASEKPKQGMPSRTANHTSLTNKKPHSKNKSKSGKAKPTEELSFFARQRARFFGKKK
ncbi:MAG: DEAD/DEAH box helicase [Rickettsiales bacterium]|nr:DEAD/DEAH box helicase [Rickettsiales bacterium]